MGFAPDQVDRCSLWQFAAMVDGYNEANGATAQVEPPTDAEFEDMIIRLS